MRVVLFVGQDNASMCSTRRDHMAEISSSHPSFFETRDAITKFLFLEDKPAPVDLCFILGSPSISSIVPAVHLYQLRLRAWRQWASLDTSVSLRPLPRLAAFIECAGAEPAHAIPVSCVNPVHEDRHRGQVVFVGQRRVSAAMPVRHASKG